MASSSGRALIAAALLVVGCAPDAIVATTTPTTATTAATPTSTLPPVVECPGTGEFGEGGGIAEIDGEGSDSSTVGRITWDTSDLCESFHIDFETPQGAPATMAPDIRVEHLDSYQIVRITMDVETTMITDQLVETNLVDRLYVVRALDGGLFIDLHLAAPAAVRASAGSSPARLNLDLRPGFVAWEGESAIADNVVLVAPSDGSNVGTETTVSGYARTFEATVLVVVTQGGDVIDETTTTAADYLETWGQFRLDVGLPPGDVSLFAGESSQDDGSLEGVTVDLTVS